MLSELIFLKREVGGGGRLSNEEKLAYIVKILLNIYNFYKVFNKLEKLKAYSWDSDELIKVAVSWDWDKSLYKVGT